MGKFRGRLLFFMSVESEATLEDKLLDSLVEGGYKRVSIDDEDDLEANFKRQLEVFNGTAYSSEEFNRILIYLEGGSIFDKAKKLRDQFVLERDDGENVYVKFINQKHWCKNEFQVSNQITFKDKYTNRYDVTILINGLPLVQVELKRRGVELKKAFNQIKRYQLHSYHNLFNYIQIFVISNGVDTKYFANNSDLNFNFTFFWKDKDNHNISCLNEFADSFLEKCQLSKMIARYMVLNETSKSIMVLRAYQYYAVEAVLNQVSFKTNGYVWHTTGSGKTLTSFKICQILAHDESIDKVMFIVDRKDLDYQTSREFNSFCDNAVDGTDNTKTLIKQLSGANPLIITTIQKLHRAINNHEDVLNSCQDKRMILIFDECHRSQFGDMHDNITDYFNNINYYGFTGTPIFAVNANDEQTTKDLFGKRLHSYLIKDAIRDHNVLGFSIDYIGTYKNRIKYDFEVEAIDTRELMESSERLNKIVDYIIENHDRKTYNREFTSIFCVSSVSLLNKYYDIFKSKNHDLKIATIFTYEANPELDGDELHPRDKLEEHIKDYNEMFGTNYSTDTFNQYYVDVSKRSKNNQIDILLVVNMFLTGFDNKLLNTLYVDKNLQYHGLLQAFSRTNRIYNDKKMHGNIVCFRNLKKRTDQAIRLFSDKEAIEVVTSQSYDYYLTQINSCLKELLELTPTVSSVDYLKDEEETKKFILIFRDILRLLNRIITFTEFDYNNLQITEQDLNDYKSKYLDIYDLTDRQNTDKVSVLKDVDFEIELLRTDNINVAYIINLLRELDPESPSFDKDKKFIHDIMQSSHNLKSKSELIDNFITENIVEAQKPINIDLELPKYFEREKNKEINELVNHEKVSEDKTRNIIKEYEYSGKFYNDEIKKSFTEPNLGFLERKHKTDYIKDKIINLVEKFALI